MKSKHNCLMKIICCVIPFQVSRYCYLLSWCKEHVQDFVIPLHYNNVYLNIIQWTKKNWHVITFNTTFQTLISSLGLTLQFNFMSFELHKVFKMLLHGTYLKLPTFWCFLLCARRFLQSSVEWSQSFSPQSPNHSTMFSVCAYLTH